MMKFTFVRLDGEFVKVAGPSEEVEGAVMNRVDFGIAQPGVMTQGTGATSADGRWSGLASAEGLQVGEAFAFGVAHLITRDPGVLTFTWFQQVEVTG